MDGFYQHTLSDGTPGPIHLLERLIIDLESPVSTVPSTPTLEALDINSDPDESGDVDPETDVSDDCYVNDSVSKSS